GTHLVKALGSSLESAKCTVIRIAVPPCLGATSLGADRRGLLKRTTKLSLFNCSPLRDISSPKRTAAKGGGGSTSLSNGGSEAAAVAPLSCGPRVKTGRGVGLDRVLSISVMAASYTADKRYSVAKPVHSFENSSMDMG